MQPIWPTALLGSSMQHSPSVDIYTRFALCQHVRHVQAASTLCHAGRHLRVHWRSRHLSTAAQQFRLCSARARRFCTSMLLWRLSESPHNMSEAALQCLINDEQRKPSPCQASALVPQVSFATGTCLPAAAPAHPYTPIYTARSAEANGRLVSACKVAGTPGRRAAEARAAVQSAVAQPQMPPVRPPPAQCKPASHQHEAAPRYCITCTGAEQQRQQQDSSCSRQTVTAASPHHKAGGCC